MGREKAKRHNERGVHKPHANNRPGQRETGEVAMKAVNASAAALEMAALLGRGRGGREMGREAISGAEDW